jgi:hypothetical protein
MVLSPYDQSVYDAGYKYIPQSQYLLNPFQVPAGNENEVPSGLPAIYQPGGSMGGGGGGGDYAASLGLGPNSRGYMDNFQNINPSEMYSYTPQGITIEDLTNRNINDFAITGAPPLEDQSGYIKPAPEIFEPQQQNMFQKTLGKGFDLAKTAGSGILSFATGIPFAGQLLEKGLGALSGQFENRPLGAAIVDEFGNVYNEEELNKSNALGGYYTDAARSARRRTSRIQNMLERQKLGKRISLQNLQRLQAQEKKQEEIRQAAAKAMQDENRDRNRGGYQSDFRQDSGFMEGPSGAGTGLGASDKGGSDTMGSFMNGGIVDLVDIYD